MLKAVIFDFDGVLIDSTFQFVKVFQKGALEMGLKIPTKKDIINTFGLTWPEMIKKIFGRDKKYRLTLEKIWEEYEDEMKLAKGLENILTDLRIKKAIATSAGESYPRRVLKDLIKYFDVIVTRESTKKHKPYPEPLLLACKKLKIKPAEAVYVGDHLIDFETAQNAGMDFIGILSGGTTKEEFEKAGVKKIINSLGELLQIVK